MVESMVERVARAMFNASRADAALRGIASSWEAYPLKEPFLVMARAAIEAMREPTDAMVDAGSEYVDEERVILVDGIFNAMIDSALSEQVSG